MKWIEAIQDKKVIFITTKNLDYLRNTQEMKIISKHALEVEIIGSMKKVYIQRLVEVYSKYIFTKVSSYDVIFCGFAPQLMLPLLKIKKSKVLIIDFFISCYDTLVFDRRVFRERTFIAKLIKMIDVKTLNLADMVIGDTKTHCAYFCDEFKQPPSKFEVLYLEADKNIYYPREKKEVKLSEEKKVLYFGSILPLQGIEVVLEASTLLPDITFMVIGPVKNVDKESMRNVKFISWLPQENLADTIAEADLCLAGHFNADIMKAKRTTPGKAYIYEAMGKPMILGDNLATRELYDESQPGIYFVEMGSGEKLAEKIQEIFNK